MGARYSVLKAVRGSSDLAWRWGFNLGPTIDHRRRRSTACGEVDDIVDAVRRDGIAISTIDALPSTRAPFEAVAESIARRPDVPQDEPASLLGAFPQLGWDDPALALATASDITRVADIYFGLTTRVLECKVWRTCASESEPSGSQLWHRDRPADRRMLKCFVYLTDVRADNGPFSFVPGTHALGARASLTPTSTPSRYVPRTTDDEMARWAPRETWRIATGPAGTVVFADTSGLHRGGWVTSGQRTAFMAHFGSQAAWQKPRFALVGAAPSDSLLSYRVGRGRVRTRRR